MLPTKFSMKSSISFETTIQQAYNCFFLFIINSRILAQVSNYGLIVPFCCLRPQGELVAHFAEPCSTLYSLNTTVAYIIGRIAVIICKYSVHILTLLFFVCYVASKFLS